MSKATESIKSAIKGEYIADASAAASFAGGTSQAIYCNAAGRLDLVIGGSTIRFEVTQGTLLPVQATATGGSSDAIAITVLHNN